MAENKQLEKRIPNQLDVIQAGLQKILPALNQAIPQTMKKYLTAENITKVAFLAIRKNPDLVKCTPESIYQCVMEAGALGLEVGGMLGHAHLVPFRNLKKNRMDCQLIIGYPGYINMARRSGEVASITAQVVYRNDVFDIDLASGKPPIHRPKLDGDRGEPYLVYCVAQFKDGGCHPEMMTRADIEAVRRKSKMPDGPAWRDNFWAMGLKSVIRKARKMWPLSTNSAIEMAKAEEIENRTEDWSTTNEVITEIYKDPPALEAPRSRTDEVLAKIQVQDHTNGNGVPPDNLVTGETTFEDPGVNGNTFNAPPSA